MCSSIPTLVFLLRIVKTSQSFAPKFVESHYGKTVKKNLRQLEAVSKEVAKHQAYVEFLQTCATYYLYPRFVRFKLHQKDKYNERKVKSLRQNLIIMEIRQKRKDKKREKRSKEIKKIAFETLGLLARVYVKKFQQYQVKSYETLVKSIHKRKLKNLGLSPIQSSAQLNVVRNLSSRSLTKIEYNCLNYGL